MYENTEKFVDLDFEQHVRQRAYHLWEAEGRPEGRETDYWFSAMEQLLAERGDKLEGTKQGQTTITPQSK